MAVAPVDVAVVAVAAALATLGPATTHDQPTVAVVMAMTPITVLHMAIAPVAVTMWPFLLPWL